MSEKKRNRIIYSPIQLKGPTETSYLEVKIVTIATKVSMSALDLSGDEYIRNRQCSNGGYRVKDSAKPKVSAASFYFPSWIIGSSLL